MTEQAKYKLIIETEDAPPDEFLLTQPVVQVGRDPARNDLVLAHSWVSRAHLRIYCDREPYRVQDMGSSNGTLINDAPLPPNTMRPLGVGDVITLGPFRLIFAATGLVAEPEHDQEPEPAAPSRAEIIPPPPPEEGADQEALDLALLERLGTRRAPGGPVTPPSAPPPEEPPTQMGELPPVPWVGMPRDASRWLEYLPPIYGEDDFLGRFLLVFEDLLGPIQQIISHFDLFLDPATAPERFVPWLNDWMAHLVDEHWSMDTQRELLRQASWLHQARGTRSGLTRHLEIATGCEVEIVENAEGPHTFRVTLRSNGREVDRRIVERIIELNRPAHTSFTLRII